MMIPSSHRQPASGLQRARMLLTAVGFGAFAVGRVSGSARLGRMKRELSAARHAADHDPLTGLPNRCAAEHEMCHRQARGEPTYVALLDLDGFKRVNDTYGHACGDELLRVVAARLTKAVAAGGFAARFGGDEFLMLLPADAEAIPTASSVLEVLAEPAALHDVTLAPRASAGITRALPGNDWASLLCEADAALYRAKRDASGVEAFSPLLQEMPVRGSKVPARRRAR